MAAFTVDALAVDEIIVTTRKREENLQSVPIAVQAITAQDIERKGLVNLNDIVQQSSSLILDQGFAPQDTRIVIRGLSPTRGRQNAAVLQDGIDVSSEAIATAGGSLLINPRLFDLERVEIVKGPQVALYGRSAFNGAINYITRRPGDEFRARVGTDIGSDGQLELSGGVDGPIGDGLKAGLTGMVWSHDGFYENTLTGQNAGDAEGTSVAGTLVWEVTEGLSATLRVENLNDEFGVSPYAKMPFNADFIIPTSAQVDPDGPGPLTPTVSPLLGSVPGIAGDALDGDDLILAMSEDPRTCDPTIPNTGNLGCRNYPGTDRDITRGTLTVDWDVGPVMLTSLTHYADASVFQFEGSEDVSASTPVTLQNLAGATRIVSTPAEFWLDNDTTLFSQELRVASNTEGRFTWMAGGLIWKEKVDVLDGSYTCVATGGFSCGPLLAAISPSAPLNVPDDGLTPLNADKWTRDTDHYSVFGLVEWKFLDQWRLALEGRQTWEDLEVKGPDLDNGLFFATAAFPGAPTFVGPGTSATTGSTAVANSLGGTEDDSYFAPKVTVTWTPTSDQLYYVSWAESFKPKGISALLAGTGAFYNTACGQPGPQAACTDPIADFRFEQEKLDNYELGAKTAWFANALRLNGAVFYQDFKNKQVSTQVQDPETGLLRARDVNAGKAEVFGAEIDATWFVNENITLGAAYTWLDTEYTEFVAFTTGTGTIAYVGNCDQVTPTPTTRGCNVDYSGNELEGAPEHAWVGNARWQANLAGATDYFVEGNVQYQSSRYVNNQNLLIFPNYSLFDFRAGIVNDTWDIVAYIDNAFDDDSVKTGFVDGDIPSLAANLPAFLFLNKGTLILPEPRTYGLRLNYRFGGE